MGTTTVAIFNDTAGAGFGCDAVMTAIEAGVAQRGGEIVHRHRVGHDWQKDPMALSGIEGCDVVVVNGEGTIHHARGEERPAARWLAALGPHCAKRSKACYLVNATIQANDERLMDDLRSFSGVWVRERFSEREVTSAGIAATRVGDLSFFHRLERPPERVSPLLVTDSAKREMTSDLWAIAKAGKARIVSTEYKKGAEIYRKKMFRKDKFRRRPLVGIETFADFAHLIGRHDYLVTGRFHAMCFAILTGVPFSVGDSNSWKCAGVIADAGLDERRMFTAGSTPPQLPFSADEVAGLSRYVDDTRSRIEAMFDVVLGGPAQTGRR